MSYIGVNIGALTVKVMAVRADTTTAKVMAHLGRPVEDDRLSRNIRRWKTLVSRGVPEEPQQGMPLLTYEGDGYPVAPAVLRQVDVHIQQILEHFARTRDSSTNMRGSRIASLRSVLAILHQDTHRN